MGLPTKDGGRPHPPECTAVGYYAIKFSVEQYQIASTSKQSPTNTLYWGLFGHLQYEHTTGDHLLVRSCNLMSLNRPNIMAPCKVLCLALYPVLRVSRWFTHTHTHARAHTVGMFMQLPVLRMLATCAGPWLKALLSKPHCLLCGGPVSCVL